MASPAVHHRPRFSRSALIARKEFREIFRDRRTIISVIISPLLVTPALFALMGILISGQQEKQKTETYAIGVSGASTSPSLMQVIKATPNATIQEVAPSQMEAEIKSRHLNAVAVFPENAEADLKAGKSVPIRILFDVGNQSSQAAAGRVNAALTAAGQQLTAKRLEARGLPTEYATPLKITQEPIKTGGSAATFLLSMMLPYILAVSAFSGAIYAAFDQVAGEKERGTLETLLVSPASRRDIVLGKFSAVVGVCMVSSILSTVGLIIAFTSKSKAFAWLAQGGLKLSPSAIGVTVLVLLPLSILFAGLLLAVSTFARNQKEAQTYLAPLFIAVLMPAMMSMFLGTEVAKTIALVPVLGASIIIKQALSGIFDPGFIGLAFAASVLYAALALAFATRLFQKESVLIKA